MVQTGIQSVRREQILDAAAVQMEEHGWAGVTFAAICRTARITNGVLTYHFRDKEELLFALYERTLRCWRDEVWGQAEAYGPSFEARITAVVREMLRRSSEQREFRLLSFHFLSLATERPDIAARMHVLQREMLAKLIETLRFEAASGATRRTPEEAAAVVFSAVLGFGLMSKAFEVDAPEDALVEMLTSYLAPSPPAAPATGGPDHT